MKITTKNNIRKEYGNVIFFEKVSLLKTSNGTSLKEYNVECFDKAILEYKKHFLCFTKNEIIFIGYSPVSKAEETPKVYQKSYKIDNIEGIRMIYKEQQYNVTRYETKTTYKTIRPENFGSSYTEEVREDVPYSVTKTMDVILYGSIYFKNALVQRVHFDFIDHKKSTRLTNKIGKITEKLNINYRVEEDKENN